MTTPPPPVVRERPLYVVPLIVSTAFLMEALDGTIITASFPAIAASFGVTPIRVNLAITSYVLALAIFIPISGWVADRFGARRVFLAAICVFTLGSIACGLSTSLTQLVAARILQGLGGALMTPVGRLIMLKSVRREDLVTALAYMTMPVLIGPLLGPIVGGWLTTYASWRWIFFINIPVGVIGLAATLRFIADLPPEPRRPFDFGGFLICGLALVLLQVGLENIVHPVVPTALGLTVIAGSFVLLALYARAARRRDNPALDVTLFDIRPFRSGVVFGGLSRIGLNAVPFLLQFQLQVGFGYSALAAGGLVFIAALGALSLKPMTTRVLRACGFRALLAGNGLIGGALTAGFALLTPTQPTWLIAGYIFLFGLSRSLQFNSINGLIYAEMPRARQSAAVGIASVAQQLTMSLGVSLSATALALIGGAAAAPSPGSYAVVFLIMSLLPIVSGLGFLLLDPNDGATASGHRPSP